MARLTIAALQAAGTPGDAEANLRLLRERAREAAAAGAGLLVTSEMFVTGYDIGDRLADFASADLLGEVRGIAGEASIALLAGMPEWDAGSCWNAAFMVGADGEVLARYRKTHLFGDLDRRVFAPGAELVRTVDLAGVRVAVLICYDVEFPEPVRAAAEAGAHLVAVPTAQMAPFEFVAEQVVRVRAWENQVYVAYVNHDGTEGGLSYVGRSSIVAPSGEVLASAVHGDTLLLATVDTAVVDRGRRENPYLTDLRRDLLGGH